MTHYSIFIKITFSFLMCKKFLVLVFHFLIASASYLQVLVPKRSEFKGKMIEVDIYEAGKHFMKGRPVEDSKPFTPSIAAPLRKGEVSGLMQVNTRMTYPHIQEACLPNTCLAKKTNIQKEHT